MSSASKVTQLQDRMADRSPRIQITEINELQPEPEFDSVGAELRAHRNRKGHELEMAGRVLRIKPLHLEAIEESKYDILPGKAYAIGFVRSYAEYLGLDPNDCIRRFKLEYAEAMEPQPAEGEDAPRAAMKTGGAVFPEARDEMRLPHGSMIIFAAMLILGIWGGWYMTTNSERAFTDAAGEEDAALAEFDELPPPSSVPATSSASVTQPPAANVASETATSDGAAAETAAHETTAEEPALTETTSDAATTAEEPAPATETATLDPAPANEAANITGAHEPQVFGMQNHDSRVILRARADAWVRIEDLSGSVLFEGNMVRGDSYRVPNRASIVMATRNAGAVEMLLDGQSLGPAGAIGQAVIEQSLDPAVLEASLPTQP